MSLEKDQQKGHAPAAKQPTSMATHSKDSTFCNEHNKDKVLCAEQHVNHGKPVTGSEQQKEQHKK
jgi:3-mercaptopyruvate sulfurtransferase SseA